jgi:acetylglutamate kinase
MRVVKLGGRTQLAAELATALAGAWRADPGTLCVVHGGGEEISALQRALGVVPSFIGGRRVTTARDLDIVRMVLSGTANKRLVTALTDAGAPAWGVSGEDAGFLEASPLGNGELGYAGAPTRVRGEVLQLLLQAGYMPVISPMARNADGSGALNVNGDDAAAAIAAALAADELLFLSNVAGVRDASGATLARLDPAGAQELIDSGAAIAGMRAKLEAAHGALTAGVRRVRIGDVACLSDSSAGTLITSTLAEVLV